MIPIALGICFAFSAAVSAQTHAPAYSGVGRSPTQQEIHAWDISIGPEGKELPPGKGTPKDGAKIFARKCAVCHGPNQEGAPMVPALVGGKGTLNTRRPVMTIGSYWPYATTLFDYIRRAMPRNQEGSLTSNEAYALTAFLLFRNGIVAENFVNDAKNLPKVRMPNRDGLILPDLKNMHDFRK